MAIGYGGVASNEANNGSALVVTKPVGTVAEDVLCAIMFSDWDADPALMAAPSVSWIQAGSTGVQYDVGYGKVWTYSAGPSEPANYTFIMPKHSTVLFLLRLTDAAHSSPIDVLRWSGQTSPKTDEHVAKSVDPNSPNVMHVAAVAGVSNDSPDYDEVPDGMTERASQNTDWIFGSVATAFNASGSATGDKTFECDERTRYISVSFAVNSAPVVVDPGDPDPPDPGDGGTPLTPGSEIVTWIDADGGATSLEVEWATSGRFAPPTAFEEEGVPEQPGSRLRAARHGVREFTLPVWLTGDSPADLRTRMRTFVRVMDPTRGDGRIRYQSPVGDLREVVCRYSAGLEMDETLGQTSGPTVQRMPVTFRAFDPYYYDIEDTLSTYATGDPPSFFPFFPLRLSSSEVFADAQVENSGDVEVWPVWVIHGPAEGLVLRNMTTGKFTEVPFMSLLSDETLTIDTRPGIKTVTYGDGANGFPDLSLTSSLWPLIVGNNAVRIEMTSATEVSQVNLLRRNRYLSP